MTGARWLRLLEGVAKSIVVRIPPAPPIQNRTANVGRSRFERKANVARPFIEPDAVRAPSTPSLRIATMEVARRSSLTMARETGRFFRAEYQDVAERDRLMARWMAATVWIRGHDAEKTAKEALLLSGKDETIG